MKIALFYPSNLYAGWMAQGGYVNTLAALGHEVINCKLPGNNPHDVEMVREVMPSIDELLTCDVVLSCYHEYIYTWLEQLYPERWDEVVAKVPVIARFDESFDRPDLPIRQNWERMKRLATLYSFPAEQDATQYGGQWMPFGADTEMFNPLGKGDITVTKYGTVEKKYDVAFVGSMYPVRMDYLKRLMEHLPNNLIFSAAPCLVQDLGGVRGKESTELLAENYRQIKVFFCLPPMSKLIVAKIPDIMACGTFVMYPKLPHHARMNMNQFRDRQHIVYYEPGYMGQNAKQILHYLEHEDEREAIAKAGHDHVHEKCTLKVMLTEILSLKEQWHQAEVIEINTGKAVAAN